MLELSDKTSLQKLVKKTLEKMRPFLVEDGGDVELVKISGKGVVQIRLTGACSECPYRTQTLSALREAIKKASPEIIDVVDVD